MIYVVGTNRIRPRCSFEGDECDSSLHQSIPQTQTYNHIY